MTKLNQELAFIKRRNNIYKKLDDYLESFGYIKVEPDYFEDYQSFISTNERIKQEEMVKLVTPSGRVSILRPDVTTNIMKQVVPNYSRGNEFRLFYNSTVFRQNNKKLIQSRQFGLELLGDANEVEVIKIIIGLFKTFNLSFKLDIGNQSFVNSLIDNISINKKNEILLKDAIKSKNKKEINELLSSLTNTMEVKVLKNILSLNGSWQQVKRKLESFGLSYELMKELDVMKNLMISDDIDIDLSLLSQYDYYSGIVVQGYLEANAKPVLFGGRYDKLTEQFGNKLKAVGVSFDLNSFIKEVE